MDTMDTTSLAAECVNGGIVEGSSIPAPMLIIVTGVIGILFSLVLLSQVAAVKLDVTSVVGAGTSKDSALQNTRLRELYDAITLGASSFLTAEYKLCALFVVVVVPCMWISIGPLSAISFLVGAVTSMVSGLIGMKVAVFSNARCTVGACSPTVGWTHSFNTAFRAGGVMGFSLTGIALLSIYTLMILLK
jgi:Na+/H+-translocating membrane pyrophosphatase